MSYPASNGRTQPPGAADGRTSCTGHGLGRRVRSAGRGIDGTARNRPRALDAGPCDIADRVLRRGDDASVLGHSTRPLVQ